MSNFHFLLHTSSLLLKLAVKESSTQFPGDVDERATRSKTLKGAHSLYLTVRELVQMIIDKFENLKMSPSCFIH